ncbi:hypothetical protein ACF0H5_018322 [Mactra antiquata]
MAEAQLQFDRPLWPLTGSKCPVPTCRLETHLTKFARFNEHWNSVHVPFKYLLSCKVCKFYTYKATEARRHGKKRGLNHVCTVEKVINNRYINPGVGKYKYPTPEEKEQLKQSMKKRDKERRDSIDISFFLFHKDRESTLDYSDEEENHHNN